jgi:hypothetical protein
MRAALRLLYTHRNDPENGPAVLAAVLAVFALLPFLACLGV